MKDLSAKEKENALNEVRILASLEYSSYPQEPLHHQVQRSLH